jgi:hypothetical protein
LAFWVQQWWGLHSFWEVLYAGDGHVLQGKNYTNKRKSFLFFVAFLAIVLAFLFASLFSMVILYYTGTIFSKLVLIVCIILLGTIVGILIHAFFKKEIISKSYFPLCHDLLNEFTICARCKGFYLGFAFLTALVATRNSLFTDFLNTVGIFPYTVILVFLLLTVPIHGACRRLQLFDGKVLLHAVGFLFSITLYQIAGLIIAFLYPM